MADAPTAPIVPPISLRANAGERGSANNLAIAGGDDQAKRKAAATAAQTNNLEKRRASIDSRHRVLLDKFAELIGEKSLVLENSFLLGNKIEVVNEFFREGGSRRVLFFWKKVPLNLFIQSKNIYLA
jgi:dynein heavy chain